MDKKTKQLLLVGIILAVSIAIISAFIASSDPDGLDATIEHILHDFEDDHLIESPMPDYIVPSIGETPISTSIAIIIGVIVTFGFAYGIGFLLKRKKNKK